MGTQIYKVLRPEEWDELCSSGQTGGSPADEADGFIHFSVPAQLTGTLERYYKGTGGLILAELDADALGSALKWEPARDGSLFPHLYGPLKRADIIRHWTLTPDSAGRYGLPEFESGREADR